MNYSDDSSSEESLERIRQSLRKNSLKIYWGVDNDGIFANIDSFLELSEGNNIVQTVYLDQHWDYYSERGLVQTMEDWEKVGKGIRNLQALKELRIVDDGSDSNEEEPPDFETLSLVLRHVRQKITLSVEMLAARRSAEGFARAIRGHPTIQRFETRDSFEYESFGLVLPALATLPALESTALEGCLYAQPYIAFLHPEHLTTLLLSTSLRSVTLRRFRLTNTACQAVAHALKSGSHITHLYLESCQFPECGGFSIVHALKRNSTLEALSLDFETEFDDIVCDSLASLLLVNTTLTELSVGIDRSRAVWLQPFLVALRINTSLKKLDVIPFSLSDESVCGALRDMFAKNTVLEELTLRFFCDPVLRDTDVAAWRKTPPFLRDNKTLKSLDLKFLATAVSPLFATLCLDTVTIDQPC
jgi:hypothetical protein